MFDNLEAGFENRRALYLYLPIHGSRMPEERQAEKPGTLDLARDFGLIIGASYVAGLLIVNFDSARHGIWDLQLARAQYVLVGTLWIFLTALALAWLVLA